MGSEEDAVSPLYRCFYPNAVWGLPTTQGICMSLVWRAGVRGRTCAIPIAGCMSTEKSINLIVFSVQLWYNLGIEKRGYQYAKN